MVQRRNSYINQRNKKKNQMIALIMICLSIIISSIIISSSNTPQKEEKVSVVAEFDTVKIPVPAKLVPMGTKVKDIKFKYVSFPKHQIPQGALTDLSGMQEAIALTKLPANIPVFDVNFSFTAYPQNPVVDKIPQGMRAMTIRVDATSAVEGWAGSGSLVDVLLVQKHKTSENNLTQYIKFYLPVGSDFKDVTFQVYAELPFEKLHSELNGSKNKYDGTWKFENFDTVEFLREVQKAFGKTVSLIRIDKKVVNC